ncbi:UDP-N-acetylmuramate dehydrogenase [Halarsenatibacter silvermanii]|uniref:UDP-N-acetylenolpyruvoylglucosamine reductase n=1 Tax=Halarsenatibacter silvermanii TaxID=321763 RepID=A0A1G9GZK8_9FIRM|nr:UDP-N-acetylmuramate dehydrogenase [Halarsenatibacter silvermanii]SDL06097.1 UDP-N-acetylmuramate dehydrogenase [Halarsenatibacter silvermanii]
MNKQNRYRRLISSFAEVRRISISEDEPMKRHTSLRIGGPADLFIVPRRREAALEVFKKLESADIPWSVTGAGSNLLVADRGIRGAAVKLSDLDRVEIEGSSIKAEAGILLGRLAEISARSALSGLEFASGIPGTLGGAIFMNAGAYGGQMQDVLKEVEVFSPQDKRSYRLKKEELELSYRSSRLQQEGCIAVSAVLELSRGEKEQILERMAELEYKRWLKQPMDCPSAGSTFKRPEDDYAGRLIEAAGFKGSRVGNAMVSQKHAGFIVNLIEKGGAEAAEVIELMRRVQRGVEEEFDITLEPEPRPLGDFPPDELTPPFPNGTAV